MSRSFSLFQPRAPAPPPTQQLEDVPACHLFFEFFLFKFVLMTLIASIITFSKKKICYPRPSTLDKKIDFQVIRLGAGNDFRGPFVQALPLPSRVSFSRAPSLFCLLLPSACYAGYLNATLNNSVLLKKSTSLLYFSFHRSWIGSVSKLTNFWWR